MVLMPIFDTTTVNLIPLKLASNFPARNLLPLKRYTTNAFARRKYHTGKGLAWWGTPTPQKRQNNMGYGNREQPYLYPYKAAEREQNAAQQWVMFGKIRNILVRWGKPHTQKRQNNMGCGIGSRQWGIGSHSHIHTTRRRNANISHITIPICSVFSRTIWRHEQKCAQQRALSSLLGTSYHT